MSEKEYLFTSESVSEGHPDKIADRISDAILDAYLTKDRNAKSACETLISGDLLVISGEFKTSSKDDIDHKQIAFDVIKQSGYGDRYFGFDFHGCRFVSSIKEQSAEINMGVEQKGNTGAGDQGLMFGYATNETPELMPLPISLAHKLMMRQAELRKSGEIDWLEPDAKSQVTVKYRNGRPVSVEKIVLSTQHKSYVKNSEIRYTVRKEIIDKVIPQELLTKGVSVLINPTGAFTEGGPRTDTGLTGRKIIVDTYGGSCPHGGGAFSGKDATKVDRSAAYMARFAAKNLAAKGYADRCTLQVSYAIGVTEPVSLMIDTHGTGKVSDTEIEKYVKENFDFTPKGIIERLDLLRPIYFNTAAYGHFGREGFEWEKVV